MQGRDYVAIGPAPSDEDCAQVGDENYEELARRECKRFIALLRETFGPEPSGAYLSIKGFPHDFGTYYEVVCYFNHTVRESVEHAFRLEQEAPTTWSGEAGEDAGPRCPECGGELESGGACMAPSFIVLAGYFCTHCRMIFAEDGTFIATYVG